ncbi:MAG: hypothetical protein WD273_04150 [Trueperaceae bacterium]
MIREVSAPDIAVRNQRMQQVVQFEVKSRRSGGRDWAMDYFENLKSTVNTADVQYFALALRDKLYLWNLRRSHDEPIEVDVKRVLGDWNDLLADYEVISEASLKLIYASWLSRLVHADPGEHGDLPRLLGGSGFLRTVRGGTVELN